MLSKNGWGRSRQDSDRTLHRGCTEQAAIQAKLSLGAQLEAPETLPSTFIPHPPTPTVLNFPIGVFLERLNLGWWSS